MLEQQIVTFLISRIDVKLGEIRKQTEGETTQFVVDETQIFVDQLKQTLDIILADEQSTPKPPSGSRRGRNGGDAQ